MALTVGAVVTLIVPLLVAPVHVASAGAGGPAYPLATTPVATSIDLGHLGGKSSGATAVDGSVVVGSSRTADDEYHAFAVDLADAEPEMIDLGTVDGAQSSDAVDVSGSIVVGDSLVDNVPHGFVYDLADVDPAMRDIGSLGGGWTRVRAVDGSLVVGVSRTAAGESHAFVYDLAAEVPAMQDLGALGADTSAATHVDGSIVAGWYAAEFEGPGCNVNDLSFRAFAYDLAAEEPRMIELGTLGGCESSPTGLSGSVIVGWSSGHAFAYDLAAEEPAMQDLGVLPGRAYSEAADVDDDVVVGWSEPTGPTDPSAFVYDLAAPAPAMRELGKTWGAKTRATGIDGDIVLQSFRVRRQGDHAFVHDLAGDGSRPIGLGTWRGSEAADIDGDLVVGRSWRRGHYRATAWDLRQTRRPVLAFKRLTQRAVGENTGKVRIRVTRTGALDRAVTVRFRTRNASAKAGRDYVANSGKLRFGRGVKRRSITVRILDDRRGEGAEHLLVTLSKPRKRAVLGTPSWTQVWIRPSDR
ncbi:Calx-beta domain-containing protein [Nocardioides sp.]|uniref:Calx-beta domain-containing protein n=1 Tax=Nocardioides sp. TaxID=35761 RepID=UPI003566DF0F